MNWRAVRLYTRSRDLVVVPNSQLGKERIENYSFPTGVHATIIKIGFSYNDPPNKVKRILLRTLGSTARVLTTPSPVVRTTGYADSAISYDIKFFINDYEALPDIEEEFMTKVWYASRRNQLVIPFPIRTVYKTEVPPQPAVDSAKDIHQRLKKLGLFATLSDEEIAAIQVEAVLHEYAENEHILAQGDTNDALYLILSGKARVSHLGVDGDRHEVHVIPAGDYFGEISALTGELCTADVYAADDTLVLVVYRETLEALLKKRPGIAELMAAVIEHRRGGLKLAVQEKSAKKSATALEKDNDNQLVTKIRKFFGI